MMLATANPDTTQGVWLILLQIARMDQSTVVCTVGAMKRCQDGGVDNTEDLLDDYRFWRERDPELKSLAVSDPEDPSD